LNIKFSKIELEIAELKNIINELKLMSVDEVMKGIDTSVRPDKELVDNAILNILKNRVQRSVSAPSRMIVKSVARM